MTAAAHLVEVEDNIKLRHRCEERIQNFDEQMDGLKRSKLIVPIIDAHDEVQVCIAPENQLVLLELQTVTRL